MNTPNAYPLCWPLGWPRKTTRERGTFTGTSAKVRAELISEIDLMMGAGRGYTYRKHIVISTNVPLRQDGEPYSQEPAFIDPGVAVYFQRKGKPVCFACDKFDKVWKNMRAIAKTIEAMRGIERWGSSDMLDRAFTGFAALPASASAITWREILGTTMPTPTREHIEGCYRARAKERHPDMPGGSHALMTELNAARDQALSSIPA